LSVSSFFGILSIFIMSDKFIRHLVSFLGMSVCMLAWWSGYASGKSGWWWTALGVIVIYAVIYKLVEA
jgi:hypothetical protein